MIAMLHRNTVSQSANMEGEESVTFTATGQQEATETFWLHFCRPSFFFYSQCSRSTSCVTSHVPLGHLASSFASFRHVSCPPLPPVLRLVLCPLSAGIGRTGCFIVSSIGCQQLRETGQVDILETVCQLRLDRWVTAVVSVSPEHGPESNLMLLPSPPSCAGVV